jgi:DNA-binding response OmpR family regulator
VSVLDDDQGRNRWRRPERRAASDHLSSPTGSFGVSPDGRRRPSDYSEGQEDEAVVIAVDPPIRRRKGSVRAPARLVGAPTASPGCEVLVVDGDARRRAGTATQLRAAGFGVRTVADGLEALYALDRERPDVVVLDLLLPRVSGFRVLHLLKRCRPGTIPPPVLVLTALSFDEAWDAVRDGADDIATGPLAPADLVARVTRLLHRGDAAAAPPECAGAPHRAATGRWHPEAAALPLRACAAPRPRRKLQCQSSSPSRAGTATPARSPKPSPRNCGYAG